MIMTFGGKEGSRCSNEDLELMLQGLLQDGILGQIVN